MNYTYSIEYSCYTDNMHILLNNKPISRSSTIIQYMNEPFEIWFSLLPDLMFKELGESYSVIYTGTYEEAQIFESVCKKAGHCISFKYCIPQINESIQKRLSELNNVLNKYRLADFPKIKKQAVFYGSRELLEKYKWHIEQLEVRNKFCEIEFINCFGEKTDRISKEHIAFILCSQFNKTAVHSAVSGYAHPIIVLEENENKIKAEKGIIVQGFNSDNFFDVIFKFLLMFPLVECLKTVCGHIMQSCDDSGIKKDIRRILAIKAIIEISADNKVELGSSIPIKISSGISNSPIPRLDFQYQIPGVVECTQQRIYGRKAGVTKVLVFENGGAEAIAELELTVYNRNRITELMLTDSSVVMGKGDTYLLGMQYVPNDADNVSLIKWYSDNDPVATVSGSGEIKAVGKGKCRIFCSAEAVSNSCVVVVKEYADSLDVKAPCLEDGYIHMLPGERLELNISVTPADSFDHNVQITSNNMLAVNVIGHTLMAVDFGEADIIVENSSGRLRKTIKVVVEKKIKKQKRGFFR